MLCGRYILAPYLYTFILREFLPGFFESLRRLQISPKPKKTCLSHGKQDDLKPILVKVFCVDHKQLYFRWPNTAIEKLKYLLGRNVSSEQRCPVMVLWLLLVARPVLIMEERTWSRWYCTKYQLGVHWATRICGDGNFQRARSAYWSQAAESFLIYHFAEIPHGMTSSGSLSLAGVSFQCRIALSDPAWAVSSPLNTISDCQMLSHRLAFILPVLP